MLNAMRERAEREGHAARLASAKRRRLMDQVRKAHRWQERVQAQSSYDSSLSESEERHAPQPTRPAAVAVAMPAAATEGPSAAATASATAAALNVSADSIGERRRSTMRLLQRSDNWHGKGDPDGPTQMEVRLRQLQENSVRAHAAARVFKERR